MADSPFKMGHYSKPSSSLPPRPAAPRPAAKGDVISCRATNPLSLQDDLEKVFLDSNQAKATTATRLFRNDELFDAIRKIVSEFIKSGKSGKFAMWSSGCSSGEEVYSMGMIALNEFDKAKKQPMLEAFGTDINPERIAEGRSGLYGKPGRDSLSQAYWVLLTKYAEMDNSQVQMGDLLRTVCKFAKFDMRNKPKNHTFHLIVCNHVLQYYDAPGQRHIIGNLKAVLKPGGYLYLEGVTEHGLDGLNLKKLPDRPYLYQVNANSGMSSRGITRRLLKK